MKRDLLDRQAQLSADEQAALRTKIANAEARLKEDLDAMRGAGDVKAQRGLIGDDLAALRGEISALRAHSSDSRAVSMFESLDSAWARANKVDRRAVSVMSKLERAERSELAMMRSRLAQHIDALPHSHSRVALPQGLQSPLLLLWLRW